MLAMGPDKLTEFTRRLSPAQLLAIPEPGEWSARDVLAHLRACADMWGKYIVIILSDNYPKIKAVNPTTWIKQTNYCQLEFKPSLQAFTTQRAELLGVLQPLAPEDWSRKALVIGGGKPRERSVYTYGLWLANHEKSHFKQVEHIVTTVNQK